MGLYSLLGIIVMMLAAIVVTKAARKSRGGSSVSRGPGESLAATAGSSQK
jgi:uncharacterized MAPEG superfamily protein